MRSEISPCVRANLSSLNQVALGDISRHLELKLLTDLLSFNNSMLTFWIPSLHDICKWLSADRKGPSVESRFDCCAVFHVFLESMSAQEKQAHNTANPPLISD